MEHLCKEVQVKEMVIWFLQSHPKISIISVAFITSLMYEDSIIAWFIHTGCLCLISNKTIWVLLGMHEFEIIKKSFPPMGSKPGSYLGMSPFKPPSHFFFWGYSEGVRKSHIPSASTNSRTSKDEKKKKGMKTNRNMGVVKRPGMETFVW